MDQYFGTNDLPQLLERLKVDYKYSLLGEKVATLVDQPRDPGYYFVNWDSRNDFGAPVAAGMYIYQIRTENFVKSRKLILLK